MRAAQVAGVEVDATLAAQARGKLAGATIDWADMCEMDLGRRFDVVLCLYGSIAYTRTRPRLRRAAQRLLDHRASDGLLVVQPWCRTVDACPRMQVRHVDHADAKIARLSRTTIADGPEARIEIHYLIGTDEIAHVIEHHLVGIFSEQEHRDAFGPELQLVEDALGPGAPVFAAADRH